MKTFRTFHKQLAFVFSILLLTQPLLCHGHATADAHMEDISHQIEHQPQDQMLHLKRAMVYLKQGDPAASWKDLEKAKQLGPHKNLWRFIGHYYNATNKPILALKNFNKHLELEPMDFSVIETRAELFSKQGDLQNAIKDYEFIINNNSQIQPGYYLIVADLLLKTSKDNRAKATEFIQRGAEKLNYPVQLVRRLIDAALEEKSYKTALRYNEKLIEKSGDAPHLLAEKAQYLALLNRTTEAQANYRKALNQLKTQRLTPARKQLIEEINKALSKTTATNIENSKGEQSQPRT